MHPKALSGGFIVEVDLGDINDLSECHQSLYERELDFNLSAMLS